MRVIEVKERQFHRYKQEENFIPPGEYILWQGRPNEELKKFFPFIPACGPKGFRWLLPCEEWILKDLFNSTYEYEIETILYPGEIIRFLHDHEEINLHPWQNNLLKELFISLKNKKPFRRGLIVGLGGGKTLVALLFSLLGTSLYIAPRHLHGTIKDEAIKWNIHCPDIVTPESAWKKHQGSNFKVIILDECLSCKNPDARRSQGVTRLMENVPVILSMTGTPISAKRALDARWLRTLGTIVPKEEKHWKWKWGNNPRHEIPKGAKDRLPLKEDGTIIKPLVVDSFRDKEICSYISEHIHIVDISEIMKSVPECRYEKVFLPQPKMFPLIKQGLLTQGTKQKRLMQARTCTGGFTYSDSGGIIWTEKEPVKIKYIRKFIEDNPEEPITIFSNWSAELEKIYEIFSSKGFNPALISDSVNTLNEFLEERTNVLICSSNLTEGMNLQRCRIVFFLSNSTSPVKREQAEGRFFRQGQKRGVIFHEVLCRNTLDEVALALLKEHKDASEAFIKNLLGKVLDS